MKNNILPLVLAMAGSGGTGAFIYKGSCNFENLPTTDLKAGYVYDILNDFTLDGKHYPAGTNVAWTGTKWDPLGGNIDLSGKEDLFRYTTMPTASADNVGKIVQYIGDTTSTYTNGNFYKCVSDGETPATYSWEEIGFATKQYVDNAIGNTMDGEY